MHKTATTALALALLCAASAGAAPAGVTHWSPVPNSIRPKLYAIRDTSAVPRKQDVIFGPRRVVTVLDLAGLLADFGLDANRIALAADFEVDRDRSGYRHWVVLQQWHTEQGSDPVRVETGRIVLHADAAGMVDYLEWAGYDDPVAQIHRYPTETVERGLMAAAFQQALSEHGDEVMDLIAIEPLYVQAKLDDKIVLVAAWAASVYTERRSSGRRAIERILIRAAEGERWTVMRRSSVLAESGPAFTTGSDARWAGDWDELWGQQVADEAFVLGPCSVHRLDRTVSDVAGVAPTRREGDVAVGHPGIDTTYDALGESADALYDLYDWCEDQPVDAGINRPGNTSWYLGGNRIELGAGDGVIETSNAEDRDVVYHESVHRVIRRTTNFGRTDADDDGEAEEFHRNARALNESFADIFAAVMDAYHHGRQSRAATWKMFEDSYIDGDAIRYLDRPADNQQTARDHFDGLLSSCGGNPCNSHQLGGMSSLSFYLAAEGGDHPRLSMAQSGRLGVNGIGWEEAGRLYFDLLDTRVGAEDEDWFDLRVHLTELAAQRHGLRSPQLIALCKAFDVIGVWGTGKLRCAVVPGLVTGVTATPSCKRYDIAWNATPGATRYIAATTGGVADLESAIEFYNGTVRRADYRPSSRRYVYVRACNAETCGPWSVDHSVAEPLPTGASCE